jgi:hypothetical protein
MAQEYATGHKWKDMERQSFKWFFGMFLVMAAIGLLLGGLIDKAIQKWQFQYEQSIGVRIGFAFFQLFATVFWFYLINLLDPKFDNWLLWSYSGFIFVLMYFMVQQNLEANVRSFFNF